MLAALHEDPPGWEAERINESLDLGLESMWASRECLTASSTEADASGTP
jgi:hypothetical protein